VVNSRRRHKTLGEDEDRFVEQSDSHVVASQKPDGHFSLKQTNTEMTRFHRPILLIIVLAGPGQEGLATVEVWLSCVCERLERLNIEVGHAFIS
jgi:hypothetical protein